MSIEVLSEANDKHPAGQDRSLWYWSAVVIATLVGLATHLTLNTIGLATGFALADPRDQSLLDTGTLPVAVGLWWIGSVIASLFVSGFIIGWLHVARSGVSAFVHGGMVWALAALISLWLATTTVGAMVGGAFTLFVSTSQQQSKSIEVVISQRGSDGADAGSAPQPVPGRGSNIGSGADGSDSSGIVSGLETLSWMAVLEAARQLKDPEVRAMLRRYALAAWEETSEFRARLAALVQGWTQAASTEGLDAAETLTRAVEDILLLTPEDARRLVEKWERELAEAMAAGTRTKENGTESSQQPAPESEEPANDDADLIGPIRETVIQTVEDLWSVLRRIISLGGEIDAETREDALQRIERAFEITRREAERILERWQDQARGAASAVAAATADLHEKGVASADAALDYLSAAAMWVSLSLIAGWLAAAGGVHTADRWKRKVDDFNAPFT